MNNIRIIYNENFFRDEPGIIIVVIAITILVIIITSLLVRRELKMRGKV